MRLGEALSTAWRGGEKPAAGYSYEDLCISLGPFTENQANTLMLPEKLPVAIQSHLNSTIIAYKAQKRFNHMFVSFKRLEYNDVK